jgi:hypothetical protein
MSTFTHPGAAGQETDPPEPRTRASALRLTEAEAAAVRIAVRKVARAVGGFPRLSILLGVPPSTVYYAARPNGRCSGAFAIRLAAVAKVPVEVLLGGKLAVSVPVIGRAA